MKKASDANGQRLVDVLDLHRYPEASLRLQSTAMVVIIILREELPRLMF